jgi:hypothetical protein
MPQEPANELRQHCKVVRARPSQHEWNMRGHQNTEVGYETCLYVTSSERQILHLEKLFLSADQINLYFIQIIVIIRQFCGFGKKI